MPPLREARPGKAGPGVLWLLEFGRLVDFCARACSSAPGVLIHRSGDVIAQFEQVAVRSLPIVVGAGLSVGMVAWLQTYRLLAVHGAESTLPSFLSVAVIVELGPLLAGLLVAGRMGAGLAAELAFHGAERGDRRSPGARERSHSTAWSRPERSPVPWPSRY